MALSCVAQAADGRRSCEPFDRPLQAEERDAPGLPVTEGTVEPSSQLVQGALQPPPDRACGDPAPARDLLGRETLVEPLQHGRLIRLVESQHGLRDMAKQILAGDLFVVQFGAARNWPFGSALSGAILIVMVATTIIYFRSGARTL